MNSKLTQLILFFETQKEKKAVDKLIKEYELKTSTYVYTQDKVTINRFDSYTLTDIRNDCAQNSIKYIDIY